MSSSPPWSAVSWLALDDTVTEEVSTTPSGPPSAMPAAAFAAESVPMLVPTSHTGPGAISRTAAIACFTSAACSLVVRKFHRPRG